MEQQILICNEPSPTSPTPSTTSHRDSTSSSSSGSSSYSSTSSCSTRTSLNMAHNFDLSPTSDSSGYDSNTSIISSINSNNDDDEQKNSRKCKQEQVTSSSTSMSSIVRVEQQQQNRSNNPTSVLGQLDQHMLDDQERILQRMLTIEGRYVPWLVDLNVYRSEQYDINEKIRNELTNWMYEVCESFKCEEEIFNLSVNYLDRFLLAKPSVPKEQLQLAGIVCMLIASKIRQCNSFDLDYLSYISEYTFTVKEILAWEQLILQELCWDVSSVVAHDYLDYILVIVSKLLNISSKSNSQYHHENEYSIHQCGQCLSQQEGDRKLSLKFNNHNQNKRQLPSSSPTIDDVEMMSMKKTKINDSMFQQYSNNHRHHHRYTKRFKPESHNFNNDHHYHHHYHQLDNIIDKEDGRFSYGEEQFEHNLPRTKPIEDHENRQSLLLPSWPSSSIEALIRRHANTFITFCSTELSFVCVKPSVIATACVATAIRGLIANKHQQQKTNRRKLGQDQHQHEPDFQSSGPSTKTTSLSQLSMFIPYDLDEKFLLAIEQQMGIDSKCIETYAQQIDNLTISKVDSDMSLMMNNNNDMVVPPEAASMSSPSKKSSLHHHSHQHRSTVHTPTTLTISSSSSSLVRNNSNGNSGFLATINHHYYNHHSTTTTTNNHYYIHTTFAQVASAKHLLLRQQQQQQQQQQQENRYYHTNNNIPHLRSSLLHDTTNAGDGGCIGGLGGNHMDDTNSKAALQQSLPTLLLTDLLSYLEQEDRENIPLFIRNPSINMIAPVQAPAINGDQENMPPNTTNDGTNGNHHHNDNDEEDEGLEEDLCF